jgi:hypothetical protein
MKQFSQLTPRAERGREGGVDRAGADLDETGVAGADLEETHVAGADLFCSPRVRGVFSLLLYIYTEYMFRRMLGTKLGQGRVTAQA